MQTARLFREELFRVRNTVRTFQDPVGWVECVEEKFGEQIFRSLSEMRILAKVRVVILDFVGYVDFLAKFYAKLDFRV